MIVHLIDGTYELFRHFYGLRRSRKGKDPPFGAVAGVLQHGAADDRERRDARRRRDRSRDRVVPQRALAGYKTGEGIDRALWAQFHPLEEALAAMGVAVWPMVELEADDALASAAHLAPQDARVEKVCIWTPDKDLAQCVRGDRVVQMDRKSGEDPRRRGRAREVRRRAAGSIPDYLALVGDAADGYPGIPATGTEDGGPADQPPRPDRGLSARGARARAARAALQDARDAAHRRAAFRRRGGAALARTDTFIRAGCRENRRRAPHRPRAGAGKGPAAENRLNPAGDSCVHLEWAGVYSPGGLAGSAAAIDSLGPPSARFRIPTRDSAWQPRAGMERRGKATGGVLGMKKRMILMLSRRPGLHRRDRRGQDGQIQTGMAQHAAFQMPPEAVTTVDREADDWPATWNAIGSVTAVQRRRRSARTCPGIVETIAFESGQTVRGRRRARAARHTTGAGAARGGRGAARSWRSSTSSARRAWSSRASQAQADWDNGSTPSPSRPRRESARSSATIARKTIRAPFSGVLGIRQVNLGQYLAGGDADRAAAVAGPDLRELLGAAAGGRRS